MVNVLPTLNQGDEYDHACAETSTVTEDNVTESLASIEQRASGILLQYASLPSLDKMSPRIGAFNTKLDDRHGALTRFRMHLNGLNMQHGKSNSVVASQGTSRASSPGPDREPSMPAKPDLACHSQEADASDSAAEVGGINKQHVTAEALADN